MMQFQTNKRDFTQSRLVEAEQASLSKGEILVGVESFSFTANNITYAAMGKQLKYWQFFPAGNNEDGSWGMIPVWGFANVLESASDDVAVGERFFGYFPPATSVVLKPANVSPMGFFDGAEHRSELAPGYNLYRRVPNVSVKNSQQESERSLFYPLYLTSFILHDYLKDNAWFSAEQIFIGAASSKTSIGLAYALSQDESAPNAIALTSARNVDAVKALGLYDTVLTYEQLDKVEANKAGTIVDMSANSAMLAGLNDRLQENLKHCINVGLTHWQNSRAKTGIPSEKTEMFFAPSQIQKRMKDWGPVIFEQKSSDFILQTAEKSRDWLHLKNLDGLSDLAESYNDVCQGRIAADQGLIIKL